MREQIKELCIFMICGQTLLYFQSGKKYEKICRMILELLVLAGIVGMILNVLQSFGIESGEMQAAGGAVAGMRQSMEEALSRQLDMDSFDESFMSGIPVEDLVEKYTENEIKSKYNYFAAQYGVKIEEVEQKEEKLQVFLKEIRDENTSVQGDTAEMKETNEGNPAKNVEIEKVEIGTITPGEGGKGEAGRREQGEEAAKRKTEKVDLATFHRQFALVLGMEEENLEVILIDR